MAGTLLCLAMLGCTGEASEPMQDTAFVRTGTVRDANLTEISGIQAGAGHWFVHNDGGKARIYVVDLDGNLLASMAVHDPQKRKWKDLEDLTIIPGADGPLLVLGDVGDNLGVRSSVHLLLVAIPVPDSAGNYPAELPLLHATTLRYPDGPRDCEAMAYDSHSGRILLMSKRDVPPRLYGLDAQDALTETEITLDFLGEVHAFRPPTARDFLLNPARAAWFSQPTGMDISPDGRRAAVITYRSIYLFNRRGEDSWPEAFRDEPIEIPGPPGSHDEAVGFSREGDYVIVTTERLPAPLYRLDLDGIGDAQSGSRP